ncbi:MAG: hypothetical protein OXI55_05970 [Gammaproteobacteria bacterium]|nr:hypothetical protein [Gammaproteobacteria bacterium]
MRVQSLPNDTVCKDYCDAAWERVDLVTEAAEVVTARISIAAIRQQYGDEVSQLSDEQIADAYWREYYSDLYTRDAFMAHMLDPPTDRPTKAPRPAANIGGRSPELCLASCRLCGKPMCLAGP